MSTAFQAPAPGRAIGSGNQASRPGDSETLVGVLANCEDIFSEASRSLDQVCGAILGAAPEPSEATVTGDHAMDRALRLRARLNIMSQILAQLSSRTS
jgi:hypothetical protein